MSNSVSIQGFDSSGKVIWLEAAINPNHPRLGALVVAQQAVTPVIASLGNGNTAVIPVGAKGWTVSVLAGVATINGIQVPTGFSDSDTGTVATAITVIGGAAASVYVRYNN